MRIPITIEEINKRKEEELAKIFKAIEEIYEIKKIVKNSALENTIQILLEDLKKIMNKYKY